MRVLAIIGTRPEAVKMAPVLLELAGRAGVRSRVCVTGQHRQMLDDVLALFGITPDVDLDVMRPRQSPTAVAAEILRRLEPVLVDERPDWVLVQGDTTTAATGALAAFYAGARVGHVEAGLRSHELREPFPEEVNRRIAGVIADLHFAPTPGARDNLLRESVPATSIHVTGNTVIDALQLARTLPVPDDPALARVPRDRRFVLVTAHRRESFGPPLERICRAVCLLAERFEEVEFVFPVHRNPAVRSVVWELLGGRRGITLLEPLGYRPLVELLERAWLVLTDSGGLQEEAPSLGTPVLVLREVTERREGVEAGTARLVGTDTDRIVAGTAELLTSSTAYAAMSRAANPYGDGRAAGRIVDVLTATSADGAAPTGGSQADTRVRARRPSPRPRPPLARVGEGHGA